MPTILDIETRSAADLKKVGAYRYAEDRSTDIVCVSKTIVGEELPVIAHNAGLLWPKNAFIKRPGTITVQLGAPMESLGTTPAALNAEVEAWIESRMEALCPK